MGALLGAFFVTALLALCFWESTRNERMAIQGFLPHRVEGSAEVFWFRPIKRESIDLLKGF